MKEFDKFYLSLKHFFEAEQFNRSFSSYYICKKFFYFLILNFIHIFIFMSLYKIYPKNKIDESDSSLKNSHYADSSYSLCRTAVFNCHR